MRKKLKIVKKFGVTGMAALGR